MRLTLAPHPWLALAAFVLGAAVVQAQEEMTIRPPPLPDYRDRVVRPRPVSFPPFPYPLGQPLPRKPAVIASSPTPAVVKYSDFANEPFYPQLATHHPERLDPHDAQMLRDYLAEKILLQAELRAAIAQTAGLDPAARQAIFDDLARTQAPRIATLERRARRLAHRLAGADREWSYLREWRLNDGKRPDSPEEIAQVLRAAAFFEDGLSQPQRDLLRVLAEEIHSPGSAAPRSPRERALAAMNSRLDPRADSRRYLHLPPAPARIPLPDGLPPEVLQQIRAYEERLAGLKRELRDAVIDADRRTWLTRRTRMSDLAERQAPQFAELEKLADAVRRHLADHPDLAPAPVVSPLTAAMDRQLDSILERRRMLEDATTEAIAQAQARYPKTRIRHLFHGSEVSVRVEHVPRFRLPRQNGKPVPPETEERLLALEAELVAITNEYNQHYMVLARETLALQKEVAALPGLATPQATVAALSAATRHSLRRLEGNPYDDYRLATLTPGLTTSQRRLLFDAAVARLEQAPPPPERQPVGREPLEEPTAAPRFIAGQR